LSHPTLLSLASTSHRKTYRTPQIQSRSDPFISLFFLSSYPNNPKPNAGQSKD
jgi:hypothetical protein